MNKPSGIDDLAGLMSETDLSPAAYKTFAQPSLKKVQVAKERVEEPVAAPVAPLTEPAKIRNFVATPVNDVAIPEPAPDFTDRGDGTRKNLALLSNWTSWSGLDLAFGPIHTGSSEADLARLNSARAGSFVIAGIAGGVGATSIVTGLARLCAKAGRRALLLDPAASSVLPLYFGSRSTRLQLSRFVLPGDPRGGAIHICQHSEPLAADPDSNWVRAAVGSLASDADSLFIDAGQAPNNRLLAEMSNGVIRVITITPETRCLAKLAELEREPKNGHASGETAEPLLLLNQFDGSDPLHLEIRARLERKFPERLIPVVIRYSREVSVALAEGCTVFDFAPHSAAASDLRALYRWFEDQHPASAKPAFNYKVQAL